MSYYSERENASIFNEDDIKELSANISKMFCNFVNQRVNNDGSLKKYIENYKPKNFVTRTDRLT